MNSATFFHLKHRTGWVRRWEQIQTSRGLLRRKTSAIEKTGHCWLARRSIAVCRRSWRDFYEGKPSDFHKERKSSQKKKRREGLWKLPQPWKSEKGGLRHHLLDDSHRCLEKPPRGTAPAFPPVTTGPAAINNKNGNWQRENGSGRLPVD